MINKLKSVEAEYKARMYKGLNINNTNAYVVIQDNPTLNLKHFTLFVKLYPQTCTSGNILVKGKDAFTVVGLESYLLGQAKWLNGWGIRLDLDDGILAWIIDKEYLPNKWITLASTYNEKDVCLYMNGVLVKSQALNKRLTQVPYPLYICYPGKQLLSYISVVKIYNRALSDSEIKYLNSNPFEPLDKDHLVLDLTPASIDMANGKWWDLSGKGNHGTIYNATEVKLTEPEVSVI